MYGYSEFLKITSSSKFTPITRVPKEKYDIILAAMPAHCRYNITEFLQNYPEHIKVGSKNIIIPI